ncbi:MAG: tetratricopeptide repeat protein, partial [Pseudomonadota bacterium]|nr:tetratricopeptide repeat protein [Pseudomonadota bacterium]
KTAYTKALSINPKHTRAMEYMGEMYLSLNQPEKAEELLSRLEKLCSYNCKDRDLLRLAIKKYKATSS